MKKIQLPSCCSCIILFFQVWVTNWLNAHSSLSSPFTLQICALVLNKLSYELLFVVSVWVRPFAQTRIWLQLPPPNQNASKHCIIRVAAPAICYNLPASYFDPLHKLDGEVEQIAPSSHPHSLARIGMERQFAILKFKVWVQDCERRESGWWWCDDDLVCHSHHRIVFLFGLCLTRHDGMNQSVARRGWLEGWLTGKHAYHSLTDSLLHSPFVHATSE